MSTGATPTKAAKKVEDAIAAIAAAFPETIEENPWGHRAFKVRRKTFLFLATDGDVVSISVKLPESGALALSFSFAEPTGYGLGASGWVSARTPSADFPVAMVREWIAESFAAIAPKKLLASLEAQGTPAKKAPAKKAPAKKAKSRP